MHCSAARVIVVALFDARERTGSSARPFKSVSVSPTFFSPAYSVSIPHPPLILFLLLLLLLLG